MNNKEKPYWYPQKTDSEWAEQMRRDMPEYQHFSDDDLREKFADGKKYHVLWDHTGDAYEQFEKLADAYLEIMENATELEHQLLAAMQSFKDRSDSGEDNLSDDPEEAAKEVVTEAFEKFIKDMKEDNNEPGHNH